MSGLAEMLKGYLGGGDNTPRPEGYDTPLRPMIDPAARTRAVGGSPEFQGKVDETLRDAIREGVEPFKQVGRAISGRSDNPVPEGLAGGLGVAMAIPGGIAKGALKAGAKALGGEALEDILKPAAKATTGGVEDMIKGALPAGTKPGMLHLHSQIAEMSPEWHNVPVIDSRGNVVHNPINSGHVSGPILRMNDDGTLSHGILAYHGSPHDFERFDLSKIGTGEGAQAYGHGLYFAENEGVAKGYRDTLARNKFTYDGKPASETWEGSSLDYLDPRVVSEHGPKTAIEEAIPRLKKQAQFHSDTYEGGQGRPNLYDNAAARLERLDPEKVKSAGKMYQVGIRANPEHFLDWDKPLSEQPEHIRSKFSRAVLPGTDADTQLIHDLHGADAGHASLGLFPKSSGAQAYNSLVENMKTKAWRGSGGPKEDDFFGGITADMPTIAQQTELHKKDWFEEASRRLREAGIPGIKYLDQGSRVTRSASEIRAELENARAKAASWKQPSGHPTEALVKQQLLDNIPRLEAELKRAESSTRNFVVFDDKLIDILKKYGIAGIGALPAMNAFHYQDKTKQ